MPTTINDTIRHLLMEEDQVCLPGLGTLRLQQQPALISPIETRAMPPSETVSFNANLVLDDGLVVRYMEEHSGYGRAEAEALLAEFLRDMREILDAGRSFTIDGVGRFFKHFDGQLRFTAEGENFSKDSFGLPMIELRPIVRNEKQRRMATDPLLAQTNPAFSENPDPAPAAAPPKKSGGKALLYDPKLRKALWYVVALLAIMLVCAALFKIAQYAGGGYAENKTPAREEPASPIPPDRVNVAPGPPAVDAEDVRPGEAPRLGDSPRANRPYEQPDDTGEPPTNAEPPTNVAPSQPATTGNVALIATGLFGSQRNVDKNTDRIRSAGFATFARPEGRLTRIGARLEYDSEDELFNALNRIRRLYGDAFVMEINGEVQEME